MRFIGNKENLVAKIYELLKKHKIIETSTKYFSFFDMFSGSASVGKFFKARGFEVTSCDLLYFSYCLQRAYLQNNTEPMFQGLQNIFSNTPILFATPYQKILHYLNNLEGKQGFIYNNYAPSGTKNLEIQRKYFSDNNATKIDAVRQTIEEWKNNYQINENEYFILLATLLESVSLFANVAGVYAAFCKTWDKRALKPFTLREIELLMDNKRHFCYCDNSVEILEKSTQVYDFIYLDPPYNHRQYAPNYHVLETLASYDNPSIKGVAGLRQWQNQKSNFCNAKTALVELERVVKCTNYKTLILSYNSEGIMQKDCIEEILRQNGKVTFEQIPYLRFKSKASQTQKYIYEYLWIVQRC